VAATIIASGRADPRLDSSGNKCIQLKRQLNAYKTKDGPVKHQKALVPEVYRCLLRHGTHPREIARAHLLAGALFFAMRSCEYSKTQNSQDQKTKPIRPVDITFRIGPRTIPHNNQLIFDAETVEITFEDQKNGILKDQVIQQNSNDPELNPIKHWAHTIKHLHSYPNYDPTWPVYHFYNFEMRKYSDISSQEILDDIRATVDSIGPDILGFTSKDVGTHSNRSGCAMMMYLAGTPVYTIMLVGRWLSDAFLRYIEKQIKEFTFGVSERMLLSNNFYNIPVRPWTQTDTANSRSTGQFHRPSNNIDGSNGSLRSQLRPQSL
jgi:hypothetical protein